MLCLRTVGRPINMEVAFAHPRTWITNLEIYHIPAPVWILIGPQRKRNAGGRTELASFVLVSTACVPRHMRNHEMRGRPAVETLASLIPFMERILVFHSPNEEVISRLKGSLVAFPVSLVCLFCINSCPVFQRP